MTKVRGFHYHKKVTCNFHLASRISIDSIIRLGKLSYHLVSSSTERHTWQKTDGQEETEALNSMI